MAQTKQTTVAELEQEQAEIGAAIETAAVREDAAEYVRLCMRRDAIPAEVREAKAAPLRAEIERLEAEESELAAEEQQVREQPPELPEEERLRGVNPAVYFNRVLGGVVERRSAVGKELREARKRLREIEREDDDEGR